MVQSYAQSTCSLRNGNFFAWHDFSFTGSNNSDTVLSMSRDHNKTVTPFVLLTDSETFALLTNSAESKATGKPTFEPEYLWASDEGCGVRVMTLNDIKKTARSLKGYEAALFRALLALRGALQSCDKMALDEAKERMESVYQMREERLRTSLGLSPEDDLPQGPWWNALWRPGMGISRDELFRIANGLAPGRMAEKNPAILLSYEVSNYISSVAETFTLKSEILEDIPNTERPRIVLWWFEGALRPAIYCEAPEVILYIHTFFLAQAGVPGFRLCPKCGEQFFQDRANQDYCCPAHREAHRVARLRHKRRQGIAQKGRDGE